MHVGLALWKLANRRTWRLPAWEAAQIALGLLIPFLGVAHVMTTRDSAPSTAWTPPTRLSSGCCGQPAR